MEIKGRGAFICLEGIDRSGKTTQSLLLDEYLRKNRDIDSGLFRFPNRTTETGKLINAYLEGKTHLDGKAMHLLFSANRWECWPTIFMALSHGSTLIVDRYSFSGIAYTMASRRASFITLDWCCAPEEGLPAPDVVIYLKISPEKALARGTTGEKYETSEYLERAAKIYEERLMGLGTPDWRVVDADRPVEFVQADIRAIAEEIIKKVREKPLNFLKFFKTSY